MSRRIVVTLDQLYRPQPGGIGTYVRGLLTGLRSLHDSDIDVRGLVPRGTVPSDLAAIGTDLMSVGLPVRIVTRLWSRRAVGVPGDADVVHATSMTGPYSGGKRNAVHSVGMHDLLWRDEATSSTSAGIRFHETRLRMIVRRDDLRIFTSSPELADRLVGEGVSPARLHYVRLGVDDEVVTAEVNEVTALLADHGVEGPYTLYAGTREPRKNLARLISAHREAHARCPELGPLVLAGPEGWGSVDIGDTISVGMVSRSLLKGLFRYASVVAYVPLAEGWGLPPVEALHAGTRVVVSAGTPSVATNPEVIRVDPLDTDSIASGLLVAIEAANDDIHRQRRSDSVRDLTWRNCALDHLKGWS